MDIESDEKNGEIDFERDDLDANAEKICEYLGIHEVDQAGDVIRLAEIYVNGELACAIKAEPGKFISILLLAYLACLINPNGVEKFVITPADHQRIQDFFPQEIIKAALDSSGAQHPTVWALLKKNVFVKITWPQAALTA